MRHSIEQRLARLEARHPKLVSGPLIEFFFLSREAQAIWLAADGDVGFMNLDQLKVLEQDLRRFTV